MHLYDSYINEVFPDSIISTYKREKVMHVLCNLTFCVVINCTEVAPQVHLSGRSPARGHDVNIAAMRSHRELAECLPRASRFDAAARINRFVTTRGWLSGTPGVPRTRYRSHVTQQSVKLLEATMEFRNCHFIKLYNTHTQKKNVYLENIKLNIIWLDQFFD